MDPIEEAKRLEALYALNLLDTDPEDGFDSIANLAVTLTGAPMAAISLIDRDRQWFKSTVGLDVHEMPRDIAFCNHAIRQDATLYVPDARLDDRFRDNPMVMAAPNLRGYAGVPLYVEGGFRIGTLSVISPEPLQLDDVTLQQLAVLARVVEEQIRTRSQGADARRANRLLAAIADIQREFITGASSIDHVFDHLLAATLEFTGSTSGFIAEIVEDETGPYLRTQAFSDLSAAGEGGEARREPIEFRDPDTLVWHTIRSGELVVANNPDEDPRGASTLPAMPEMRAFLGVPLMEKGEVVAMIAVANRAGGYSESLVAACEPLFTTAGNLIRARRAEIARDGALAELAVSKGRYDLAIAGSAAGIWEIDFADESVFLSERLRGLIGQPAGDAVTGREVNPDGLEEFFARIHDDDRERVRNTLRCHLKDRLPYALEFDFQHEDGRYLRLYARGQAEWDESGQALRMAGAIEDITERSRLIAERESTSARLAVVTELGGIGSWQVDLAAGTLLWDQMTRRIHEVDEDYVPDLTTAVEFYAPGARETLQAAVDHGIAHGEAWDLELPFITAKGNHVWVRAVGRAIMVDGQVSKLVGSFQDVTERRDREEEAKSLSTRLMVALNASKLAFWEFEFETGAITWDARMKALFGRSGLPPPTFDEWAAALHPDDRDEVIAGSRAVLKSGEAYSNAYRIIRPDGSIRHVRSRGLFRTRLDGSRTMTGVMADITAEVERAEELDLQRARAESANRAKTQFLANMSHEIRTPLNGVLGMSQVLKQTPLSELQQSYVSTLQTSGTALLELVEDILDISKIESGTVQLAVEPFDLTPVVQSVLEMIDPMARNKAIELRLEKPQGLPVRVLGDEKRLRQVLINIIGNAVKFTDEGSVVVRVEPRPGSRIKFRVTDTGPGIAADQVGRIFNRFAQVDASQTRKHGGSGLGLAICSELVKLAGGEIGVSSQPGIGSEFWFELPLAAAAPEQTTAVAAPVPEARPLGQARILVVDDVMTNRLVASALVEHAGHLVRLAENGAEALEALDSDRFDAILMDIQMPVMSGDEAIQKIRGSGKAYSGIPIYAVTADATKGAREHYLDIGATGYLSKPLDGKAVEAALDAVLRGAIH